MFPFLNKFIPWYVIAIVIAIATGAFGLYRYGYTVAEREYLIQIEKQNAKIAELNAREETIKTQIVTEYKDRIRKVVEVQEKIVEVTRYVLGEEVNHCSIGSGFISLHNAAASNQTISKGTE